MSYRRVDIVSHHGFTGVHIVSTYAPDGLFYQFLSEYRIALDAGLYRFFEITCKCHIFFYAVYILNHRVIVCFADQALGGLH